MHICYRDIYRKTNGSLTNFGFEAECRKSFTSVRSATRFTSDNIMDIFLKNRNLARAM